MKRTALRAVAALGVFCVTVALFSLCCGCSSAATDTRYLRRDQGASFRGPERQDAIDERSRTIVVQKAAVKP